MSQEPSSRKWIVFLICLVIAAVIVASIAAVTIGAGEPDPMKLTNPDYPDIIIDNPVIIDRPIINDPEPIACLYGCPNPAELSGATLTKETEVLDYD
jgi:hypothetical protein